MIINIFLYTTDEQTAIDKTKEILSLLEIKDIVFISSEPYWKYSDMTVTHTETISNIYPDKDVLKRIADIWWGWESENYIGTSDTTADNTMHVSDVAMVDLSISKPDNYRSNADGELEYIEWYTSDDLPSPSDTEGVFSLIKEYIAANSKSFNILILRKDSVDFLYYISAWENIIAVRDYAGDFENKRSAVKQ